MGCFQYFILCDVIMVLLSRAVIVQEWFEIIPRALFSILEQFLALSVHGCPKATLLPFGVVRRRRRTDAGM